MSDQTLVSDRCSVHIVHRLEFCQFKCSPRNVSSCRKCSGRLCRSGLCAVTIGALSLCTMCATFCVSHIYLTLDLALQSTYQLRERGYGISQYVKVSLLSVKNKTSRFSTFSRLFPIFLSPLHRFPELVGLTICF